MAFLIIIVNFYKYDVNIINNFNTVKLCNAWIYMLEVPTQFPAAFRYEYKLVILCHIYYRWQSMPSSSAQ